MMYKTWLSDDDGAEISELAERNSMISEQEKSLPDNIDWYKVTKDETGRDMLSEDHAIRVMDSLPGLEQAYYKRKAQQIVKDQRDRSYGGWSSMDYYLALRILMTQREVDYADDSGPGQRGTGSANESAEMEGRV
jgi:hypothetical protein